MRKITKFKFECHWHDFDCESDLLCKDCPHCPKEEDKPNYNKPRKRALIDGWGMPVCPTCNEPTYDEKRCFFCGQAIRLKEYLPRPLIVGWKDYKGIFVSGGYWIYHKGKIMMHARCSKKMTPKEARKQLKTLPNFLNESKASGVFVGGNKPTVCRDQKPFCRTKNYTSAHS